MSRIEAATGTSGAASGVRGLLRRSIADDTPLKRALTAWRWMSRVYFEARYVIPDPWHLATSPYERARAEASMRVLGDRQYATALEAGCGEGMFTVRLLDRCDRVVAVDFSTLALRRAHRRFAGSPRVAVRRLDVRVEEPGATFDLVVCAELFYYFNRRQFDEVADRTARWVAPGGDLFLVHGTSVHDAAPGGDGPGEGRGEMSARAIHGRFCRMSEFTVLRDVALPQYRLTLLRRREGDRA